MDFKKLLNFIVKYLLSAPQRFVKLIRGVVSEKDSKQVREERNKGIWKTVFRMFLITKLPYIPIILYALMYFFGSNMAISLLEYSSEILTGNYSNLWVWIGLSALAKVVELLGPTIGTVLNMSLSYNLRKTASKKIMWIKPSFYIGNEPRELVSRALSDASSISGILVKFIEVAAITPAFVRSFLRVSEYGRDMALTTLVMAILIPFISFTIGRLQLHRAAQEAKRRAEYTQYLGDRLANLPLIKTFVAEKKEDGVAKARSQKLMDINIKENAIANLKNFSERVLTVAQTAVICFVAYPHLQSGELLKADVVKFFMFASSIISTVSSSFTGIWITIKTAQGSANRIARVMQSEEEDVKSGDPVSEADMQNDIIFEDVVFGYKDSNILNGVSFTAPKGKITAIVGSSGSGKSTLIKLMERFYDPRSGVIKLGDKPADSYNLREWRQKMGYVTQDTALMSGTIRENILYGLDREVSEAEFKEVCELADINGFVENQPHGFDTQVGEYGAKLSGGQKQRIVLARAALKKPMVMLLDEPTAALDPAAENAVRCGIKELAKNRTTILVSHKIAHVMDADQIVLIDKGVVAGVGTHEELVAKNARYKSLFNLESYEEGADGNEQ